MVQLYHATTTSITLRTHREENPTVRVGTLEALRDEAGLEGPGARALPPRVSRHLSLLLEEHPRADAGAAVRVEGEHVL